MMQPFEDASKTGKEFMDNGVKSFAAVSKGLQAITVEAADYSKQAFENGGSVLEKLASAKSLENAFEVQSEYVKDAYEGFVAQATKMGDLYAEMAKDAYKPFESSIAKSK